MNVGPARRMCKFSLMKRVGLPSSRCRRLGSGGVRSAQVGATCPSLKIMIGAGASLSQGFGQISIQSLLLGINGSTAIASDDEDHFSGNWSLTTYAICANHGPDVQAVSFTRELDTSPGANIDTFCTQDRRAISAGWDLPVGEQTFATDAYFRYPNAVEVEAHEDADGFDGLWSFSAEAMCATP